MGKNPLLSKQQRLLKNERWKPYVRYNKETDRWISKAIRIDRKGDEGVEEIMEASEIKVLMDRKQLDVIARLVAYMYYEKIDEYEELASDLRKEHIYKDLRSIEKWLTCQYKKIEEKDEQLEQAKRKYLRT